MGAIFLDFLSSLSPPSRAPASLLSIEPRGRGGVWGKGRGKRKEGSEHQPSFPLRRAPGFPRQRFNNLDFFKSSTNAPLLQRGLLDITNACPSCSFLFLLSSCTDGGARGGMERGLVAVGGRGGTVRGGSLRPRMRASPPRASTKKSLGWLHAPMLIRPVSADNCEGDQSWGFGLFSTENLPASSSFHSRSFLSYSDSIRRNGGYSHGFRQ